MMPPTSIGRLFGSPIKIGSTAVTVRTGGNVFLIVSAVMSPVSTVKFGPNGSDTPNTKDQLATSSAWLGVAVIATIATTTAPAMYLKAFITAPLPGLAILVRR